MLADFTNINNVNHFFLKHTKNTPNKTAIIYPVLNKQSNEIEHQKVSFFEFHQKSLSIANGLQQLGLKENDRIVIMTPITIDLFIFMAACFHLGIIPVFIDPGLNSKIIISTIKDSNCQAIFSVKKLLKYRFVIPHLWKIKIIGYDIKGIFITSYSSLISQPICSLPPSKRSCDDTAIISYTSGSTSKPKGTNRTIKILLSQKIISEQTWPISKDKTDIYMSIFPMITLLNLGMGITTLLPYLDYQNFLKFSPEIIHKQLTKYKATKFSSPPSFAIKFFKYLEGLENVKNISSNDTLPSLEGIVLGGDCISKKLMNQTQKLFPNVNSYVVYGSTEAEPISYISITEALKHSDVHSVGKMVNHLNLKIVPIDFFNSKLKNDSIRLDDFCLLKNQEGEVLINGPHVITEYIDNHIANQELKIIDKNGQIWHRTGDIAKIDENRNLYLTGRLKDIISVNGELVGSYPFEEKLNNISGIKRSAILSNMIIYLEIQQEYKEEIKREVLKIQTKYKLLDYEILFLENIPVDKRHFSKINRTFLRKQI